MPAQLRDRFMWKRSCAISRWAFAGRTTWRPTRPPSRNGLWATMRRSQGTPQWYLQRLKPRDDRVASDSRSTNGVDNGGEVACHFLPVVDASEPGGGEVVGGGVEQALAFKAEQVAGQIVDEVVGAQNALVAAEDVVRGRDEGEMALQPAVLGAQGVGHGHGLGGDEDFEAAAEVFEHLLGVGYQGKVFKEVFGVEKGAELLLAVERRDLPKSLAG